MHIVMVPKIWLLTGKTLNYFENNKEIKQIFSNDLIENLVRTKRQELNKFKKIESKKHWKYYVAAV